MDRDRTRPGNGSEPGRLENLARQQARGHKISRRPGKGPFLLDNLQGQEALLRDAYQYFATASEVELALSYAAEWILDNFHVVEQAVRQIREDMPTGYYRQLPKLETAPLEGLPRVYALACEIVDFSGGHLDLDRVTRFVEAYQRVTPLTMGELWALPTMLRLGILGWLSQSMSRITGLDGPDSDTFANPLPEGVDDDIVVANSILSLRMLATQEWKSFFENLSQVEQVLRGDPAGVYALMDFDTRDRYRGGVEELALATGRDEQEVAREAIKLAQEASDELYGSEDESSAHSSPRIAHVGFYLIDEGRARLEARLGYQPPWRVRLSRWLLDHPTLVYLGGIALLTLLAVLGLIYYAYAAAGGVLQLTAVGLLAVVPVSAIAVGMVNWLVTNMVPPRMLARLDFEEGIPADSKTAVVVPALLTDADEVQSLLQQIELHFLGNTDPHLYFALLTDFGDASEKHMPDDGALLEQAKAGIEGLNKKYGQQDSGPFYLFHREREWNPAENCWMGWERKRGKLAQFDRLLLGEGAPFSVNVGDLSVLPEIEYVITLDADTLLPREGARRLIATLAHPLNRAEFDPQTGQVVAGYTVLQPRVEIKPASAGRSLFARVFSGDTGLDLYSRAVSDVYQDLFGEGIYAGKGIYDVRDFERSLEGRVPENALLSHDLFEGIHGRAGLVTDVTLYEDYPSHYLAHTRRTHRWARGDWQLLPWLGSQAPCEDGGMIPNELSPIDRWKILDNLRRSLLKPTLLALILIGWIWLPGSALVWTLVSVLALGVSVFTGVANLLVQLLRGASLAGASSSLKIDLLRWLLTLVFLPYETLILIDAIASTLHRLFISRKRLLQWTTAAHTIRLFGREARVGLLWQQMLGAPLLATVTGLLMVLGLSVRFYPERLSPMLPPGLLHLLTTMTRPSVFLAATPLLILWIASPSIAHRISKPVEREKVSLSRDDDQRLRRLARRTWLYFEQFVGPDDHWLPPDHFQEDPLGLVARRTSPTNLGLLLLSTLAAYDLGYVGTVDMVLRLRPTFDTMEELEQYRGHFLNWYDTRNLKPLPPRYVSTVDSGNLVGCLLALKRGCLELIDSPILRWQRWQGLLDTLDVLVEIVVGFVDRADATDRDSLKGATKALLIHLDHIHQQVLAVRDDPYAWPPLLGKLGDEAWPELERLLIKLVEADSHVLEAAALHDLHTLAERVVFQLLSMQNELDMLLPWLPLMTESPALFTREDTDPVVAIAWQTLVDILPATMHLKDVAEHCREGERRLDQLRALLTDELDPADQVEEARDWCERLAGELNSSGLSAHGLMFGLQNLSAQAERYFQGMDFQFLFDPRRQVFHIGYNVEAGKLDANYYDLLASEARIASLLAIAKDDVPQSHWLHLARPLTRVNGTRTLLSWSGTMFEYLMPSLLMESDDNSLLHHSACAAVAYQMDYGRRRGVPWGISESGYYRFDAGMHYQYQGFGVPGLGYKRGLSEDLVIAPYASLLALPLRPEAVAQNMEDLVGLGMLGRYGFYEAIDYTPSRVPAGQKSAIVRSYMVHHQGMILLALTNYLEDDSILRRFHADPRVQSVQLLLHEQVPQQAPVETPHPEEARPARKIQARVAIAPWQVAVDTPMPQAHVISNGRYSVLITSAGGGYSRWESVDLTRWRADTTLDNWGTWIYVEDQDSGDLWSVGDRPTGSRPETREVSYYAHKAVFRRRDHDISLTMELTVSPNDDAEIRHITLTNHSDHPRRLRLTSYGELVLAAQRDDSRHPAFNSLFIESRYLAEINGLAFRRRPRSAEDDPIHLVHLLAMGDEKRITGDHEGDRASFLGRGRTPRSPVALEGDERWLTETTGATLHPIMALGQEIQLEAHSSMELAYVTLAAKSRGEVLALASRYQDWPHVLRTFDQALARSERNLRDLDISTSHLERFQKLLSVLLYPHEALRAPISTLAANSKGQSGLWAYGVSGDYPILLVRIGEQDELDLVRELLLAHIYWRTRQVKIDLVLLNQRESGYEQELHGQLRRLINRMDSDSWLNQRGGIFLVKGDQMSKSDRVLLETTARAILDGDGGSLADQLGELLAQPVRLPQFVPTLPTLPTPPDEEPLLPVARPTDLLFDNGVGGFSADGREYLIYLDRRPELAEGAEGWTPAPWVNVIANPDFGFLVSEAGAGYTWAVNSGENRITSWRNDPVSDIPSEAIYLRDEETAEIWSPTPLPAGAPAPYLVRHGAGYSVFEHHSHGLKQRVRLFAAADAPVKVIQLRLENTWNRTRRITATFYAELVLGTTRGITQQYIVPEFDAARGILLIRNPYSEDFGQRVAFVTASEKLHGLTADRTEFLGRMGRMDHPVALDRIGLAGTVQAGLDPCAALQVHLDLHPGETQEIFFLLGQGADREDALRLAQQYRDVEAVEAALDEVTGFWERVLSTVTVETPDPAMDLMLNRWLLYQALSCRIWGRSALYQSSGAFGYRDQLQDVMALTYALPEVMREQILRAARYQFQEGDVLHWWHPPSGRGVRTRCSDDLLWLPYVVSHYVDATGDEEILTEEEPFLEAEPLEPEEKERYGLYKPTADSHSLYEHCLRALEQGTTFGLHGLPLIGSHDWNDGYSRVGVEGRGESVWLGWFLHTTLTRFARLCEHRGEGERAALYRQQAEKYSRALEESAWDGRWYRRAYYDDGTPLGSSDNLECKIDSLAQSWAVLSGAADPGRAVQAMGAVLDWLVRLDDRLILLFTPPFDKTEHDPGYVKGYPPGIRENGGQYTHAALWAVWAFADLGQGARAERLFRLLNPIYHSDVPEKRERYQVEPYVVAADIYSVPPHIGHGGWTWYTGSSGWMYRLGVEAILGLRKVGQALRVDPSIPGEWAGYELTYRHGETLYRIRVENPEGVERGVKQVTLDGEVLDGEEIPLLDDGREHDVHVLMVGRRYL